MQEAWPTLEQVAAERYHWARCLEGGAFSFPRSPQASRSSLAFGLPISRPKSRYKSSPSPDCHDDGHFHHHGNPAKFLPLSCRCCLQGAVSHPFSRGWLRTGSHQTPIGIKRSAMNCRSPWRRCRPRETLVPDKVQWVSEPWLLPAQRQSSVAHCLGDPVICKQEAGQREDPIRTMAFHQSARFLRS